MFQLNHGCDNTLIGYWTARGYANSRVCQLVDTSSSYLLLWAFWNTASRWIWKCK